MGHRTFPLYADGKCPLQWVATYAQSWSANIQISCLNAGTFCHISTVILSFTHKPPYFLFCLSKKLPVMLWFIQVQIGRLILQWVFLKEQWLFHSWYPYAYSHQASASATAAVAHCQASQYMPIQGATLTLTLTLGVGMPLPHLYAKLNFNAAMKFFICAMNGNGNLNNRDV